MKKVFLSLATIAFVAAGSLTVTSCGSDDSSPAPTPIPDPELTENYVKYDGDQFTMSGAEYNIDTIGEDVAIYSSESGNEKYAYYATYFWSGNIESATSIADLDAYGMVGYYVQLQDVELDEAGNVVDFTLPYPNEADLEIDSAGAAVNGSAISGATAAALNVNTFVVAAGSGTSNFNGSISFASSLTFDYNGTVGFYTNDVSSGAKAANGTFKFKKEVAEKISSSKSNLNFTRSASKVKISDIK